MSNTLKVVLGVVGIFVVLVGLLVGFVISAKFESSRYENQIEAIYSDMQNTYANSVVQVLNTKSDVVKQYKGDFTEVVKANMERYKNDQNVMFKAIAEQAGLKLDVDLYKDLSKSIDIAYTKFESSQRMKIDVVRVYKNFLDASVKGFVAKMLGFPSRDIEDKMKKLIVNKNTTSTFETGNMEQLELFKK